VEIGARSYQKAGLLRTDFLQRRSLIPGNWVIYKKAVRKSPAFK
jgi:hypothetical protein